MSEDALRSYWHPVAWSIDLDRRPLSTWLLGQRVVCWRDASGAALAAADRCPHRGTALSLGEVKGDQLVCAYHGWRFDPSGACVGVPQLGPQLPIPARACLEVYCCEERYGLIWVCLGEPRAGLADFPEWEDQGYRHVACRSYTWRTSPGRMVENFTDFGHLGYLHDGLLGSRDDLVVPAHRVEREGVHLRYELAMNVPNANDRFQVTALAGERGRQRNTYVLTLPFTIHLACTYEDTGAHRTLFFTVQPHGDGTCTGYCYQSRDFDLDQPDGPYADFQELLAEQDRPIVESQLPPELPLESTRELHLPFDKVAVVYRRALADLLDEAARPPTAPRSAKRSTALARG